MTAYIHRDTGLIVQLEDDPTGWVVAYVPAIPGCVSQGENVPDALSNITDAIYGVLAVMEEDGFPGALPPLPPTGTSVDPETEVSTASAA